ncbi:MAG: VWA domain-containing protein [Flavobacteriales bacterium]|nr:VWA domain-containing protein [Flavobacteriales bacterium]MCB9167991.1 VWA domain-containing protein [Flavobacteriales bacterium]
MNQRISRTGPVVLASILVEFVLWAVMLTILFFVLHQVPAFRFERPKVLWAMCAGPVVLFLFLLDLRRRWRALQRFAGTAMLPRMVPGVVFGNSFLRYLFFRLGLLFLVIALAGPQFGTRIEEVKAKGVDVMVCLDVSNSMLCEDLRPDRLELAQRALAQLIDHIHGDRLGIVVFAGDAFVQLPITADRSAAKLFLASVGTDLVPTQGTAIGAAIDLAARSFDKDSPTSKAIIVITDGENHEDDAEGAARHAMEQGIVVHTIGMGTVQGGPIPVRRGGQLSGFKKDKDGNTVVSSLDEGMLQRIAAAGKGAFVRATQTSTGINELVDELRKMDQTEIGTYRFAGHEDKYALPLAIAIGLFILSLLVPERGRSGHIKIPHTA